MQLTEHFTLKELCRSEAAVRHGVSNICPPDLYPNMKRVAEALETVRAHFKNPIDVTSCYRSPEVNKLVGGSKTSAHRFALAVDFEVRGISNFLVCQELPLLIPYFDQIIYEFGEDGWVHLGLRNGEPRAMKLSAVKINGNTKYFTGFVR